MNKVCEQFPSLWSGSNFAEWTARVFGSSVAAFVSKKWIVFLEVWLLVALFGLIGVQLVPAHWTSIWMDREFTGWVAPIAQRMARGQVLYTDGAHIPMPPLPFVLMWLIHGSQVTWIDESRLNFIFQCGMLLVGYSILSQWTFRPVPLTATVAAAAYVFALPKTIAYDAIAQFLCAVCIGILSGILHHFFVGLRSPPRLNASFFGLGSVLAALTLTKQSTALGVTACAMVVIALLPKCGLARRARALFWFFAGLGTGLVALTVLIAPTISVSGMLQDVFLWGAEPKGGASRLVMNLRAYVPEFLTMIVLPGGICIALAWGIWRWSESGSPASTRKQRASSKGGRAVLETAGLGLILCTIAFLPPLVISAGFALVTLSIVVALFKVGGQSLQGFGLLAFVALGGAVAHNLSVNHLRLTYDNNLVILFVIGAFLASVVFFIQQFRVLPSAVRTFGIAAVFLVVAGRSWLVLKPQFDVARQCSVEWTEVPYLRGAKLRPEASGMRSLVQMVRENTTPLDSVLLLPNDPNVEAWWDRRRPHLSSAIIFSDQYWPKYVETDLRRLTETPPKMIIIGPRKFWPAFSQQWTGADALLIARILSELVPHQYRRIAEYPIQHAGKVDFMDVYQLQ